MKHHCACVLILFHTQAGDKRTTKHQKSPLSFLGDIHGLATWAVADNLAIDGALDAMKDGAVVRAGEDVVEDVGGEVHLEC